MTRKTSHQAQVTCGNNEVENEIEKEPFKVATLN
jgi:hypothetical protein